MKYLPFSKSASLRRSLALAFASLSVLSVTVVSVFQTWLNVQAQQEILARRQLVTASAAAQTVSNRLEQIFQTLEAVAQVGRPFSGSVAERQLLLHSLLRLQANFDTVALLNRQGQELAKVSASAVFKPENLQNQAESPMFQALVTRHETRYISPIYIDIENQAPFLTIAIPIYNAVNQLEGILMAEVNLGFMWDLVQQLEEQQGHTVYVVDHQGRLVAAGETQRVVRGDEVQYVDKVIDFMNHTPDMPEAVGSVSTGINNDQVFSTYVPLNTPDWAVVVEIPLRQAYSPLFWSIIFSSTGALMVILLAGGVGVYVSRLLAAPIFALTQAATQIAHGELTLEAEVTGPIEVSRLALAFNSMTKQLRELISNLENQARHLEIKEKKYRTLFEDSKDTIFITDLNGQLLDVNPAGLAAFGYTQAELPYLKVADLYVNPDDFERIKQELEQQKSIKDFELLLRHKDGSQMNCLITATLRYNDDEHVAGFQGMVRDITGQKAADQQRLQLSAIQRELAIASDIQQSLLPHAKPTWSDLDVACYSLPTRDVGGDLYAYYHFKSQADNSITLFPHAYAIGVGDVTGKGIPAALLMAVSQATFQAIVPQNLPPADFMADFDRALMRYIGKGQNCAFVYAEFNKIDETQKTEVTFVNAGCPAPMIKRRDGTVEMVDIGGIPLGVGLGGEMGYQTVTYTLNMGDIVILASDGLVEANNMRGEMFGFDRLEQVIQRAPMQDAQTMLDYLKTALIDFVGEAEQHDDITLVVARI